MARTTIICISIWAAGVDIVAKKMGYAGARDWMMADLGCFSERAYDGYVGVSGRRSGVILSIVDNRSHRFSLEPLTLSKTSLAMNVSRK
jgi:hypothetical protein